MAAHASHGKMEKVMHEFAAGTLRSSSGQPVKERRQAIAIGLSEARAAGEKVAPRRKRRGSPHYRAMSRMGEH